MKVEVLYIANCPSHPAAVQLVRDVLVSESAHAEIHEVLIADHHMAKALSFRGSPTIRVNGRDVAGEFSPSTGFGLNCRLYPGSNQMGLPPVKWIREAIADARKADAP